jgi:Xaa-Pro aminopeptidase
VARSEAGCADPRRVAAQCSGRTPRSAPPLHPPLVDPGPAIAALRCVKDPDELALLEQAAEVTALGHLQAMQVAAPGVHEYQVQAVLEAAFKASGARRLGYPSIVASGPNACILHYRENDRRLRHGDLLLVDAGAEYGMYTADVTRTYPVAPRFTPPQRAAYAVVLRAQQAAIRAARAGRPWHAPHRTAIRELTRGLVALGVLRGDVARLVDKEAFKPFYMHGTSHWLGLDVHDAGAYQDERGRPVRLRPGHVLTVEPGLYFDRRDRRVPRALRGIGIRIEDDVLVTRAAPRVLTAAVPKQVDQIEALRAGAQRDS